MTYPQFTPYPPSMIDNIGYAQQLADAIMRNNPLINAVVPSGLMKWYGNYQNPDGSPVNFLWIGEFLPSDPNMGGKPQKGFSLVRDDSTHSSAMALYDKSPGTPLKQTLTISSWDGQPLLDEARGAGGQSFPRMWFPMGGVSFNLPAWPQLNSGTRDLCWGQFSAIGHLIDVQPWAITDAGVSATYTVRADDGAGHVVTGPPHLLTGSGNSTWLDTLDISSMRGAKIVTAYLNVNITAGGGGAGNAYGLVTKASCHSL
jgi:hypothetical protein